MSSHAVVTHTARTAIPGSGQRTRAAGPKPIVRNLRLVLRDALTPGLVGWYGTFSYPTKYSPTSSKAVTAKPTMAMLELRAREPEGQCTTAT